MKCSLLLLPLLAAVAMAATAPSPGPPPVLSYHVHILYNLGSKSDIGSALALRAEARQALSSFLTAPDCQGRYDFGRLCMIDDHDLKSSILTGGPFVSGEWSMFVPVPYSSVVNAWFSQHHGNHTYLLHPNTGFEWEDHADWALWSGNPGPWPLDMSIFEKNKQTNEFGERPGTPQNPTCMPTGTPCRDPTLVGTVDCCNGCVGSVCN